jgi:membrane-bound metal-dependent hydrolase YbcI (DUF457 family)
LPLPIAHGTIGAIIALSLHSPSSFRKTLIVALIAGIFANLADLDFLLHSHRTFTHSLIYSGIFVLVSLLFFKLKGNKYPLIFALSYSSHAVLDFLFTSQGIGVKLFLPVSNNWYKLNIISFSEIIGNLSLEKIVQTSLVELYIFAPILGIILFLKFRKVL